MFEMTLDHRFDDDDVTYEYGNAEYPIAVVITRGERCVRLAESAMYVGSATVDPSLDVADAYLSTPIDLEPALYFHRLDSLAQPLEIVVALWQAISIVAART